MTQQSHILTSTVSTSRRVGSASNRCGSVTTRQFGIPLLSDDQGRLQESTGDCGLITCLSAALSGSFTIQVSCLTGVTYYRTVREENARLPHVSVFILLRTLPMFSAFVSLFFQVVEGRVFKFLTHVSYDEFSLMESIYWFTLS